MGVVVSESPGGGQPDRAILAVDLRDAVANGALELHYQPLACLETGAIVGYEALARWKHPRFGSIAPSVFVPLAEEGGFICQFGAWVLQTACREAARWEHPLRLAVNLSPLQVSCEELGATLDRALADSGLDASRLHLEVTEGMLMEDSDAVLAALEALKQRGVRIVMDDFGTGFSSLAYFRKFAFDKVKIDQSFIRDMTSDSRALAIVRAIISLAEGLGLSVTAEGVETEAQAELLYLEGCRQVQGYLVGRPEAISDFGRAALNRAARTHGCSANCRLCSRTQPQEIEYDLFAAVG